MLAKEMRRGERRWSSFHAWMRRLQNDWWTHGSRVNPRGVYLRMKEAGVCVLKLEDNWRDRYYCDCFDFDLQASYRFRNHPTGHESQAAYRRNDGYYDRRVWEERNVEPDEEKLVCGPRKSRRHRAGTHPHKVLCRRCGYYLETVQVNNGDWYRGAWGVLCEGCAAREKGRSRNILDVKK